jgi:nitroreductase / dihydropteridine reductase
MMDLLKSLEWRYATKRMNGTKIREEKLEEILEAIRLAPTSLGVQPFQVLVIDSKEVREKINKEACKQPQVVESSQLLVFAVKTKITDDDINKYMNLVAKTRNIPVENLDGFKGMVAGLKAYNDTDYTNWASRQAYIALGIGLASAAINEVDATPMEGFESVILDEVLGLQEKGLHSVVVMALGYRDEKNDYLANAKKVRKPASDLFIRI